MNNMKIREALKNANMKYWELADLIGIAPCTLSVRLRKELPDMEQKKIISLIEERGKCNAINVTD